MTIDVEASMVMCGSGVDMIEHGDIVVNMKKLCDSDMVIFFFHSPSCNSYYRHDQTHVKQIYQ